jgi:hypothetical protein
MKKCFACGAGLVPVNPHNPTPRMQYEGVLFVRIDGGYGMYYDDENKGPKDILICSPCVESTKEVVPWFKNLLDEVS